MQILLVEDEPHARRSLELLLAKSDLKVRSTAFGMEAVELARTGTFDLILLDLGLPDMPGQEVLEQLRGGRVMTPVLILSGDDRIETRLKGFGVGADDYLVKPYEPEELLARIRAVSRRATPAEVRTYRCGRLTVNMGTKTADIAGRTLALTGKEFLMLEVIASRTGTTITKEMFLKHLYNGMDEPELKIIDVFMCKLRKKIATANDGESYIETIWGRGYMMREPVQALLSA